MLKLYFTHENAKNSVDIESQMTTMLQTFLAGAGPIQFGYGGFINIQSPFVGTDMIALSCPRPEGNRTEQENINQNPFVKSFRSFKGIAHDFWDGVDTRREKSLDSTYDFINYATFGVTDGILSGAKERKDKMFDSKTDFANYATFGFSGMVKEAVSPEESFSKEHWLSSFGLAGSIFGLRLATSLSPVKKPGNATGGGKDTSNISEGTSKGSKKAVHKVSGANSKVIEELEGPVIDGKRVGSGKKVDEVKPVWGRDEKGKPFIKKEFPHVLKEHGFSDIVDNYSRFAEEFPLVGGDDIKRELYQITGSNNGEKGVFEWIVEPDGDVSHRRFIENGVITGKPNQIPKK